MELRLLESEMITEFQKFLYREEKSDRTISKYIHDIRTFQNFLGDREAVTKDVVISYKSHLRTSYMTTSVNSMLVALNSFFEFHEWRECKVKLYKQQRDIFCDSGRVLTKEEYFRLVRTAKKKGKIRLGLIIQTICATGIRISELSSITAEAARSGYAYVECKGKIRRIMLVSKLQKYLLKYCRDNAITSGPVFITRYGNVVSRKNIWAEMKVLSQEANVPLEKVYPHNLRHLFARSYYELEKDLVRLSDILGHSSIETTRIYTVSSGMEHENQLKKLKFVI